MTSQDILYIIGAIAGLLALSFFIGKKPINPPSPLDLKAKSKKYETGNVNKMIESWQSEAQKGWDSRPLNVIFLYNGHNFDAYEVLGIPAGSSLTAVEKAYDLALRGAQKESQDFLEAAYQAIQSSYKS